MKPGWNNNSQNVFSFSNESNKSKRISLRYRHAALEKAQSLTERVAYPDELLDDDILTRLYQNVSDVFT